ncbi:hypothetical protein D3C81_1254870 [compost metagenome]
MGFDPVTRHAKHLGIGCLEGRILITKALAFSGAAGGAVLGVEVEHHLLTRKVCQADALATGGLGLEIGDGLVEFNGHGKLPYSGFCGRQGSISASRFRASEKSRNWSRSQLIWVPAGRVTVNVALSMVPPVCGAW